MSSFIPTYFKTKVSKNRKRHKEFGLDLDLSYINKNLIAMAFPAERMESIYRNRLNDVYEFLEKKHKDHYYIFNLCSERSYDKSKFYNRVKVYPFEDHNPPGFPVIKSFCEDVHRLLTSDKENVVAIHCKAGKGRTGTMICCYLLHCGQFSTAEDAIKHYGQSRTEDGRGVTIPSQIRYVKYYERFLKEGRPYYPTPINIKRVHMRPVPKFSEPILYITKERIYEAKDQSSLKTEEERRVSREEIEYESNFPYMEAGVKTRDIHFGADDAELEIDFPNSRSNSGDIRFELFYRSPVFTKKKRLARVWINSFFVDGDGLPCTVGPNYRDLIFKKHELDIAWKKDRKHRLLPADFELKIHLEIPRDSMSKTTSVQSKTPSSAPSSSGANAATPPSPVVETAVTEKEPAPTEKAPAHESSGAEEDSEDENEWDSGKSKKKKKKQKSNEAVKGVIEKDALESPPPEVVAKESPPSTNLALESPPPAIIFLESPPPPRNLAIETLKQEEKGAVYSSNSESSSFTTVVSTLNKGAVAVAGSGGSSTSTSFDLPDGQSSVLAPSGSSAPDGYSTAPTAELCGWSSEPQHDFPCKTDAGIQNKRRRRRRRIFWVIPVPSIRRRRRRR